MIVARHEVPGVMWKITRPSGTIERYFACAIFDYSVCGINFRPCFQNPSDIFRVGAVVQRFKRNRVGAASPDMRVLSRAWLASSSATLDE